MSPALLAALAATFVLHAGQVRTLSHARVGDSIFCGAIGAKVSRSRTASWVRARKLELTITPLARGGVRASCLRRA